MSDDDLLGLINEYEKAEISYAFANDAARDAKRKALDAAERKSFAATPLKKRCGANIPKFFLRAPSGNIYEVTADCITKIEIQG